ncbi:MAG TPA: cytochrome P450 [Candidatus Binatia bacterium]|nr:cytochrome P450 [Candidatus Binatia bacterium]
MQTTEQGSVPNHEAQTPSAVEFNPLLPEFRANPYPLYYRLRAEDPVHRSTLTGFWVLSRYADVAMVLRDNRFSRKDSATFLGERFGAGPVQQVYSKWMLFRDPPDHTRLRNLVNKAFTPRAIENLRPRIQEIVDFLIDAVANVGAMDVMVDFAYPLPVIVICEMLGVPSADRDRFKDWSGDIARTLDPIQTPEMAERGNAVVQNVAEYFHALISERRRNPQEDMLSSLIAAEEQGDKLSEEELLATCILLFSAGHETTVNLIGNGTLALLQHPDQLAKLRDNPELIQSAIEESLRYDSPVQLTGRWVNEDVEIGSQVIHGGEMVLTLLGAANRDPVQFPDPDRFDITRSDNRHLAFGQGIHFCLGAALARLEAQLAIGTLLRRLPKLTRQTTTPEWREAFTLRGLRVLPVTF